MKKLVALFVFISILFTVSAVFAQDSKIPNIDAIHVFAGMNVPTQDVDKNQFRFDYMRLHVDLSNSEIKMQFRHDFASNKLQLANVSKSFGDFMVTVGRFLDPVWQLYPAPHKMEQTNYPLSICSFGVLDDGVSLSFVDSLQSGNILTAYASIYDSEGSRNISASVDVALGKTHLGYFFQTKNGFTGFGLILRNSFHRLLNLEGGMITRPVVSSAASVEFYVQSQAQIFDNTSVWLQSDYQANSDAFWSSRLMAGVTYKYSTNSHLKLFWNFTDKVAVAKITFFM